MVKRASVVICESSLILRQGLTLIMQRANYRVQRTFATIDNLMDASFATNPAIFLIGEQAYGDLDETKLMGLRSHFADSHIVALLDNCSKEQRWEAEKIGLAGVLLKSISSETLIASLDLIRMGEHVFSVPEPRMRIRKAVALLELPSKQSEYGADAPNADIQEHDASSQDVDNSLGARILKGDLSPPKRRDELSEREIEILACLVAGNSNKLIARRCDITEATVKVHLKSILRKIEVANRTQAAVWAMKNMPIADLPIVSPPKQMNGARSADFRISA